MFNKYLEKLKQWLIKDEEKEPQKVYIILLKNKENKSSHVWRVVDSKEIAESYMQLNLKDSDMYYDYEEWRVTKR